MKHRTSVPGRLHLLTVAIVGLAAIFPLVFGLNRGFDSRDEAYYIALIANPNGYDAMIHIFGFPLHIAYALLGRSIILLRAAGLASVLAAGAVLGSMLQRYYRDIGVETRGLTYVSSLLGLCYYSYFVLTPSYNLLTNVGGSLILAAMLGWASPSGTRSVRRETRLALLMALGGATCFFGKPPAALLGALAAATTMMLSHRRVGWRTTLLRAVITGGVSILLVVGTIEATSTLGRFLGMIEMGRTYLNIGNSPAALPAKSIQEILKSNPLLLISLAVLVMTWITASAGAVGPVLRRRLLIVGYGLLALNGLWLIGACVWGLMQGVTPYIAQRIAAPTLAVCIVLIALPIARREGPWPFGIQLWWPIVALMVAPLALSFGTVNHILSQSELSIGMALLGVVLAAWLFAGRSRWTTGVQRAALGYTIVTVWWSALLPGIYPTSIFAQDRAIAMPFTRDILRVDDGTYTWYRGLQRVAEATGRRPGDAVLNLTGMGAGLALVTGLRPPFYPMHHPGYAGATARIDAAWRALSPEQRRRAWIVGPLEPEFRASKAVQAILADRAAYRLAGRVPAVAFIWPAGKNNLIWVRYDRDAAPAAPRLPAAAEGRAGQDSR